jgi:hypothetical protein
VNRPETLRAVSEASDSLETFGRLFQDWLHVVRTFSSRTQLERAIQEEPRRLTRAFSEGKVADAWLAASAEYAAQRAGLSYPAWTAGRVAPEPWFAVGNDPRARALRDSPGPFKARNLFTPGVDLPLRLRAGRPRKPLAELRAANAERQRRFREKRQAELQQLRALARKRGR